MPRVQLPAVTAKRKAWNKGRIIGQKRPLLPKQVWVIRHCAGDLDICQRRGCEKGGGGGKGNEFHGCISCSMSFGRVPDDKRDTACPPTLIEAP